MKRLRKLALNLDRRCWPNEYCYGFYLRSRSLCNYVERALKSEEIAVVDSTKLVIIGNSSDSTQFEINSSEIAGLTVPFDTFAYDGLKTNREINAFMVGFLQTNLCELPCYPCSSIDALIELTRRFEEADYQNGWVHKRKRIPQLKASATLHCDLTPDSFTLKLQIESNKGLVYDGTILQTAPDELAFHYRFRDLLVDGDYLVVTSRMAAPLLRVPLEELCKGQN